MERAVARAEGSGSLGLPWQYSLHQKLLRRCLVGCLDRVSPLRAAQWAVAASHQAGRARCNRKGVQTSTSRTQGLWYAAPKNANHAPELLTRLPPRVSLQKLQAKLPQCQKRCNTPPTGPVSWPRRAPRWQAGSTRRRKTTSCGCVRPLQVVDGPEVLNVLVCNRGREGLPNGVKEVNRWYTWPEFLILAVSQCLRALKRNPYKRINARLLR